MGVIPANLARVPNALASRIALGGIQKTNRELLLLQIQLASGKAFTRPSENAIGASTVGVLDDAIERRDQRVRNLSQADATLNSLDAARIPIFMLSPDRVHQFLKTKPTRSFVLHRLLRPREHARSSSCTRYISCSLLQSFDC